MTSIGRNTATVLAAVTLLSGCAMAKNTLAQDMAWQRWKVCEGRFPTVQIKEILPNGQIWFTYQNGGSDRNALQECLKQAAIDQARPRAAVAPPAPMGSAVSPSRPTEQVSTSASAPVWKRGYEWAYRWESPTGGGTFVWSVDREETIGNVRAWVVRSGTRETYYSIPDLQLLFDSVNGAVETRYTPPLTLIRWPITPGLSWEQPHVRERPLERQTERRHFVCRVGDQEPHVVPAGTFVAYHVECRHKLTNALSFELWYSPAVMNIIRDRTAQVAGGFRERELIEYRGVPPSVPVAKPLPVVEKTKPATSVPPTPALPTIEKAPPTQPPVTVTPTPAQPTATKPSPVLPRPEKPVAPTAPAPPVSAGPPKAPTSLSVGERMKFCADLARATSADPNDRGSAYWPTFNACFDR